MEMNKMNNLSFGELKTFAQINGTVPAETNNAAIQNSNNNNISNTQSGSQSADSPSMQPQLDKDTVVFFGKEVKKKNIAIGTAIIASLSALITGIVALSKGKVVAGEDAKLTTKLKEGLKAIFIPSKIEEYNNIKNGNVETNDKLTPTPKAEEENPNSITSKTPAVSPTPKDTETTPKEGATGNNNDVTGTTASGTPGVEKKNDIPQQPEIKGQEEVKGSTADEGKDTQGTGNTEKNGTNNTTASGTLGAGKKNDIPQRPETKGTGAENKNAQGTQGTKTKSVLIQPQELEPINDYIKFKRPISQEKAELHKEILSNEESLKNVKNIYYNTYSKLSPEMQDALGLEFAEFISQPGFLRPDTEGIQFIAEQFTPKDIEKLVQNDETSIRIFHSLTLPNARLDQIADVRRGYNLSNKPLVKELIKKTINTDIRELLETRNFTNAIADNTAGMPEETITARLNDMWGHYYEFFTLIEADKTSDITDLAKHIGKSEEEWKKAVENLFSKAKEIRRKNAPGKAAALINENASPEVKKILNNEEFQKYLIEEQIDDKNGLSVWWPSIAENIRNLGKGDSNYIDLKVVKKLIENRRMGQERYGSLDNYHLLLQYLEGPHALKSEIQELYKRVGMESEMPAIFKGTNGAVHTISTERNKEIEDEFNKYIASVIDPKIADAKAAEAAKNKARAEKMNTAKIIDENQERAQKAKESLEQMKSLIQENAPTPEMAKFLDNEEFLEYLIGNNVDKQDFAAKIKNLGSNQDGITPEMLKFLIENDPMNAQLCIYFNNKTPSTRTISGLKIAAKKCGFTPKEAAATAKAAQAAQGAGNAAAETGTGAVAGTQTAQSADKPAKAAEGKAPSSKANPASKSGTEINSNPASDDIQKTNSASVKAESAEDKQKLYEQYRLESDKAGDEYAKARKKYQETYDIVDKYNMHLKSIALGEANLRLYGVWGRKSDLTQDLISDTKIDLAKAKEELAAIEPKYKKEMLFRQAYDKFSKEFEGKEDELKNLFSQVSLGKQPMNSDEYRALCDIYSEKCVTMPETSKATQIEAHHGINGKNYDIRSELAKTGKSKLADKYDAQFAALPPLERECVVYRGRLKHWANGDRNIDFDIVSKANPGDIITPDTGYSYTAMDRRTANGFTAAKKEDGMMYQIIIPKGAKVSRNGEHGGEILMPRNAQYKVVSKGKDPNGLLNVVLEYILPKS